MEEVLRRKLPVVEQGRCPAIRRSSSPSSRLKTVLGWKPEHEDLHEIIRSALNGSDGSIPDAAVWRRN